MTTIRRSSARWLLPLLVGCGACGGLSSCAGDNAPAKGEIVLAIQTDMEVPKDVTKVGIQVKSAGIEVHNYEYDVGPDERVHLPSTLGIVGSSEVPKPVRIIVWARDKDKKVRTVREVVTTVPTDRIALLPLTIEWLCSGTAVASAKEGDPPTSTCATDETCVAGACTTVNVDSATLRDYSPEGVFGGGTESGGGTCFDTIGCFSKGFSVPVKASDCTVALPTSGEGTNVGLVLPPGGDGICGPEACIVPLDKNDAHGWKEQAGRIKLPVAVCNKLDDHTILAVALTTACKTKDETIPICGPWSSVGADAGTFDAGAPDGALAEAGADAPDDVQADAADDVAQDGPDAEAGPFTCPAPTDPTKASLCVPLVPEYIAVLDADPTLDGKGKVVVEVFDGPVVASATLLRTFMGPAEQGIYSQVPAVFDNLPPGNVYLRAVFYDNPAEVGQYDKIQRGGAWVGGVDFSIGAGRQNLNKLTITAGKAVTLDMPMTALRRLNVNVAVAAGIIPADDGQGGMFWVDYGQTTTVSATQPAWFGAGRLPDCANLTTGIVPTVQGYVIGEGTHGVVATFDDANQLTGLPGDTMPGSLPGSITSGTPGALGSWSIVQSETVSYAADQYEATMSVSLSHVVAMGGASPYACPLADGGVPDAAEDALPDAPQEAADLDAGPDGSVDASTDAPYDAYIPDASTDAPYDAYIPDASTDAPYDAYVPDASTDAPYDAYIPDAPDDGTTICNPGAPCQSPLPGSCSAGTMVCSPSIRCIPSLPQPELCDNQDNDCDGVVDDGNPEGSVSCTVSGQQGPCADGVLMCASGGLLQCQQLVVAGPGEIYGNERDDDCNGAIDDCIFPNGTGQWKVGRCEMVSCNPGYLDVDKNTSNGCESQCVPSAEVCDGVDNNCDGVIDEAALANADCVGKYLNVNGVLGTVCHAGACKVTQCGSTLLDEDGVASNGCETLCPGSGTIGPEVCDGKDNNCDGVVDNVTITAPGCWNMPGSDCAYQGLSWGVPLNANCFGLGANTSTCALGTVACDLGTWVCKGGAVVTAEVCDNVDNDCNGAVDDNPIGIFGTCGANVGSCAYGIVACVNGTRQCLGASIPVPETCDGLDNDCNGFVDDNPFGTNLQCGTPSSVGQCVTGTRGCVSSTETCNGLVRGPVTEICNGLDDDCNESVDEGLACP